MWRKLYYGIGQSPPHLRSFEKKSYQIDFYLLIKCVLNYSKIKDNQFCPDCGDKLERIIEWDGPTNLCTSCYGVRDYKSNWTTGGKKK